MQEFGAIYSTERKDFGRITAIFPVEQGWKGFNHHGYCLVPYWIEIMLNEVSMTIGTAINRMNER